ncbi:bacterial type II secretion system protein F domain protein [mine drainage metagenome]|uniref:Bacterial type II secretion system protein F domain protein n=1 Tax=mine drainage metagenome TaxID=410659 RepID=A0A1J5SCE8_9ZZZZ
MLETLIMGVAALAAFASVLALSLPLLARDRVASRMKAVARHRQDLSRARAAGLQGHRKAPRPSRLALMRAVITRLNLQALLDSKSLKDRLAQAGWRAQSAPLTYLFARVATPVLLLAFGLLYANTVFAAMPAQIRILVLVLAVAVGAWLPTVVLVNAIQKRQAILARAFPDALDLLVICVEAGLSVEASLTRVVDEMSLSAPELSEEIGLTAAELAFVGDRRQAWSNLAERTGLAAVKSLSTAMVQSEKYGTPVGVALKTLAQESRDTRMAAAEKKAASLPARLTVPMIVFFLPVLFVVIAGPAALQVTAIMK